MKKAVFFGLIFGAAIFAAIYWYFFMSGATTLSPVSSKIEKIAEKPLKKYSFDSLKEYSFEGGPIEIGEKVEEESEEYDSYIFYFPIENLKDPSKPFRGSGFMNVPTPDTSDLEEEEIEESLEYPVIVQFRGFVPPENFTPGEGSRRSGEHFATNGFITLAPDYLGFGESDMPSEDSLEERFQTYTMALSMLSSAKNINEALSKSDIEARWDGENVGVWGHSNGGHIALSALAISGSTYPTVLWNPVSKPFPYSILYYTDEYDDNGQSLRKLLADFEENYDIELYSPPNYYKWIKAPIQVHQGLSDQEILPWWSEELVTLLDEKASPSAETRDEEESVFEYIPYANSDHNLMPDGWESAVETSAEFYMTKFGIEIPEE